MKKIKLPIQHYYGETEPPNRIFVKIDGEDVRPFEDKECTKPLNESVGLIYMELEVPDDLELIEIPSCGVCTPAQDVSIAFCFGAKIKGACGLKILWDDGSFEVPVNDEIVDVEKWKHFLEHDETGQWLFAKGWILEVWTLKNKVFGMFRFHQRLIRQMFIPKEIKDLPIELSNRHEYPCLWEKGGREYKAEGNATIICDAEGKKKKSIFIQKRQSSSNHALLRISEGDIVINANVDCFDNEKLEILQIESIDKKNYIAKVFKIAEYSGRVWRCKETADKYKEAYTAALEKAKCVNCDKPFYVLERV